MYLGHIQPAGAIAKNVWNVDRSFLNLLMQRFEWRISKVYQFDFSSNVIFSRFLSIKIIRRSKHKQRKCLI